MNNTKACKVLVYFLQQFLGLESHKQEQQKVRAPKVVHFSPKEQPGGRLRTLGFTS